MLCCKLEVVVIFFRYQVRSYEIFLRVFSLLLRIIQKRRCDPFYFCKNMFTVIYNEIAIL